MIEDVQVGGSWKQRGVLVILVALAPLLLGMGGEEEYVRRGPFAGFDRNSASAELFTVSNIGSPGPGSPVNPQAVVRIDDGVDDGISTIGASPFASLPAGFLPAAGFSYFEQNDLVEGDFDGDGTPEIARVRNDTVGAVVLRVVELNEFTLADSDARSLISEDGLPDTLASTAGSAGANPWRTPRDGQGFSESLARPERTIRIAAGQLDDDPEDEIVVAYINLDREVTVAVYDFDSELGLSSPVLQPVGDARSSVPGFGPLPKGSDFRNVNALIEVATVDLDGDVVDEIVVITPGTDECEAVGGDPRCGFHGDLNFRVLEVELVDEEKVLADSGDFSYTMPVNALPPGVDSVTAHWVFLSALEARSAWLSNARPRSFLGVNPQSLVLGVQYIGRFDPTESCCVPPLAGVYDKTRNAFVRVDLERCSKEPDQFCEAGKDGFDILEQSRFLNDDVIDFQPERGDAPLQSSGIIGAKGDAINLVGQGTSYELPKVAFCMDVGNVDNDVFDEIVVFDAWELKVLEEEAGELTIAHETQGLVSSGDGRVPDGFEFGRPSLSLREQAELEPNQNPFGSDFGLVEARVSGCTVSLGDPDEDFAPNAIVDLNLIERLDEFQGSFGVHYWQHHLDAWEFSAEGQPMGPTRTVLASEQMASYTPTWRGIWSRSVAADFRGDGVTLGEPGPPTRVRTLQPLVYLATPPTHFDILPGEKTPFDPTGCFTDILDPDLASGSCSDFQITYEEDQMAAMSSETTFRSSWSASVSANIGIELKAIEFSSSLERTYGKNFTSTGGQEETVEIGFSSTRIARDEIYGVEIGYDFWEYPILGLEEPVAIGVLVPIDPQPTFAGIESMRATNITPRHEPGNLLSYAPLPPTDPAPFLDWPKFPTEVLSFRSFSLNFENAMSTAMTTESIVETKATASLGFSKKAFSFGVDSEFEYDTSDLATQTTVVTMSQSIDAMIGGVGDGDNVYSVTPFVTFDGPIVVVDYAVEMNSKGFVSRYGDLPDAALNLPLRFDFEKGLTANPNQSRRLETKSVGFFPSVVRSGSEVQMAIRVHNMSLEPMFEPVDVEIWNGNPEDPMSGAVRLDDPGVAPVVSAPGIPAQGLDVVTFNWEVPQDLSGDVEIWFRLAPREAELRTDNNLGFRTLQVIAAPEPTGAISTLVGLAALVFLRARRAWCRRAQ